MVNKRVLIIQNDLFLLADANVRIVFRLAEYMTEHGCDVSVIGIARTTEEWADEYHGIRLIHSHQRKCDRATALSSRLGRFKVLRYILYPRTIWYRLNRRTGDAYYLETRWWIERHMNEFDAIVACCSPYYPLKMAAEFANRIPVLYYKMDPVASTHDERDREAAMTTIESEIAWDNRAMKIITTDVIFRYYNQLPTKVNSHKVILANYPNVSERHISGPSKVVEGWDRSKCNIVFIGKFYADIRHPQYLFDMMERLAGTDVILHIVGPLNTDDYSAEYIDKYFTNKIANIRYHGVVPPAEADDIMLQSDVVVHLGNKVDSLMPSKILDYISSGKPILNLYQLDTCPTLPLMARYPMVLNIDEQQPLTDKVVSQIVEFCRDNKGKQIDFATVSLLYKDCTVEYVGNQFVDAIQSAIDEFNKTKI